MRLQIRLLIALFAVLIVGCNSIHETRVAEPFIMTSTTWIAPLSTADMLLVRCVALTPDGEQVLIGMRDGRLLVWQVGTATMKELAREQGEIDCLCLSPDCKYFLASIAPGGNDQGRTTNPLRIQLYEFATGRLIAHAESIGLNSRMSFNPHGDIAVVTSGGDTLRILKIPTLAVLVESSRPFQRTLRPMSQPGFFQQYDAMTWDVIGIGQRWRIEQDAPPRLIEEYRDQPDAWINKRQEGVFVEEPSGGYRRTPSGLEWDRRRDAAIIFAPIDLSKVRTKMCVNPNLPLDQVCHIPGGERASDLLVAKNANGVIVIDLASNRYSKLFFVEDFMEKYTLDISVSLAPRRVAACGTWGVSVWPLPETLE